MNDIRLARLLANLGYGSRREVIRLIDQGAITLDNAVIKKADATVDLEAGLANRMLVSGEPLDPLPPLTIMMNKPAGYVCSHGEPVRSVYDLLPPRWRRRRPTLSSIGRLDADTTGLLLITDDGALNHLVTSPRRHLPKRYVVELALPLSADVPDLFASGSMRLGGDERPLAPAWLRPLSPRKATLVLTEGRYHQVKRMFDAVGNRVLGLHRDQVGGLALPAALGPGRIHILESRELDSLVGAAAEHALAV